MKKILKIASDVFPWDVLYFAYRTAIVLKDITEFLGK